MTFTFSYINYSILYCHKFVSLASSKNVDIDAVETCIVLFFKSQSPVCLQLR